MAANASVRKRGGNHNDCGTSTTKESSEFISLDDRASSASNSRDPPVMRKYLAMLFYWDESERSEDHAERYR
jgi:hypothetical protein